MTYFPKKLLNGYSEFMSGTYQDNKTTYKDLAEKGQKPETMIICCCDSRAAPETVFNADAGSLFVVRNVANLVGPYDPDGSYQSVSAALEFAVQALKIKNIVVMGHAKCGGVQASLTADFQPLSEGDFIGKWTALLAENAGKVKAEADGAHAQTMLERVAVKSSVENLKSYPFISDKLGNDEIHLCGAWFDVSSGELWVMNPDTGAFSKAASA